MAAGLLPKVTPVAPARSVPVILTRVPPAAGPDTGEMSVTTGGAAYVYGAGMVAEPPGVVTVTVTGPAAWAGVTAVIAVGSTYAAVTAVVSKVTVVVPVLTKPVPVMVTVSPPAAGPASGVMPVAAGTAMYV
jgi:hypothetical protein